VTPLVVLRTDGLDAVRALLLALGWPVTAVILQGADDVRDAVAGTVRLSGTALVADARSLADADFVALCDDLRRLGRVRLIDEGSVPTAEAQALLDLLALGRSLGDAATTLHLSRRSADRRLADARSALAATTTAQAVARSRDGALALPFPATRPSGP
jgi:hypothetical protein